MFIDGIKPEPKTLEEHWERVVNDLIAQEIGESQNSITIEVRSPKLDINED